MQHDEHESDKTYWGLPATYATLIVRIGPRTGEEVAPLGNVLLPLLSPNLDLLILATAAELVLLQAALALIVYRIAGVSD